MNLRMNPGRNFLVNLKCEISETFQNIFLKKSRMDLVELTQTKLKASRKEFQRDPEKTRGGI